MLILFMLQLTTVPDKEWDRKEQDTKERERREKSPCVPLTRHFLLNTMPLLFLIHVTINNSLQISVPDFEKTINAQKKLSNRLELWPQPGSR